MSQQFREDYLVKHDYGNSTWSRLGFIFSSDSGLRWTTLVLCFSTFTLNFLYYGAIY